MMVQKVIRGRWSSGRLGEMMNKVGMEKPLIVGRKRNFGLFTGDHAEFDGYHSNPDFSDALPGAECFRKNECDGIIAVGGGSAIDTGKTVKALLMAENPDDALHGKLDSSIHIPLIAIPTTAGSGAEATSTAVVYVDGMKHSVVSDSLLPDGVILDSSLLSSLSRESKISSAMDALSQGIESYISKNSTEDSQVLAYLGVLGVVDNIRQYLDGEIHAADEMIDAAYNSGKAIQLTRTTAAHAMSYPMTMQLGIPHGRACLLTLPALWDLMIDDPDELPLLMDLAAKMRLGSEYLVPRLLRGMIYDLDADYCGQLDDEQLDRLTDAVNMESLKNHPMELTRRQIRMVYARSLRQQNEGEKQMCLDIWRYYGQE